ncbi:hypothetical protein P4U05_18300 [Bacillus paranthracis]|uniref:hypothetical protein n=1 Tax=Bacillus cereus group TaxID=86661 RepID=UPI000A39E8A9|nr:MULTISPECIES: hypothetical protein [Bacillus cereus group]MRC74846.1 hypothetical protein [Bacillus thuringiensis]OTX75811.1 hypothetical protein BK722_04385 [Bacillus thuringiensis serovar finitimus]MEC3360876.1 hypothetical protein [Bacillus paranthracis]MED0786415.1 hypothetical protein [Bacillus paranthracis]MED0811390.1 hypothetical protein [Bacillus paranthracis]
MNKVTIKFGSGTAAWKDMQEVAKILQEKGYSVQQKDDIGTVKLTKEIKEESEVRHISKLEVGDKVVWEDEIQTINFIKKNEYGDCDIQIGGFYDTFCGSSEFEMIE